MIEAETTITHQPPVMITLKAALASHTPNIAIIGFKTQEGEGRGGPGG